MGRSLAFEDEDFLQDAIDKYFKKCKKEKKCPTMAELAYDLGIGRATLYNYKKEGIFSDTIKRARDYIIACYESVLVNGDKNKAGIIFIAKNYGYSDKQEIEHTVIDRDAMLDKLRKVASE